MDWKQKEAMELLIVIGVFLLFVAFCVYKLWTT